MTLSDASVPGGIKSIKYAVWSEKTDRTILSGMKVKRKAAVIQQK